VTRTYVQRARAAKTLETKQRILQLSRKHLPTADELRIEEIAKLAKVSIQTLYSHFGSKGGLLGELFEQEMNQAGLYGGFERVWSPKHGEQALRRMLESTLAFWQSAWPLIEFALRVRRTDRDVGARIEGFDKGRLGHLQLICRRLQDERRLRRGLSASRAARLAFSLSTPYVYEALVVQNEVAVRIAYEMIIDAVIGVIIDPATEPVVSNHMNWVRG
jgi:AcrR family transcriptional regulator